MPSQMKFQVGRSTIRAIAGGFAAASILGLASSALAAGSPTEWIYTSQTGIQAAAGCDVTLQSSGSPIGPLEHRNILFQVTAGAGPAQELAMGQDTSFWQMAKEGESAVGFLCGRESYMAFDVFDREGQLLARVGLDAAMAGRLAQSPAHSSQGASGLTNHLMPAPVITTAGRKLRSGSPAASAQATTKGDPKALTTPSIVGNRAVAAAAAVIKPVVASAPHSSVAGLAATGVAAAEAGAVVAGALEYVLCADQAAVPMWDGETLRALAPAPNLTEIKPLQTFVSQTAAHREIGGQAVTRIQLATAGNLQTQWVPSDAVKLRAQCARSAPQGIVFTPAVLSSYRFPTRNRASVNYKDGERAFGSGRDGGKRIHAACDIYRPIGENVTAIAGGTVVQGLTMFYQGVYELQVRQADGTIARYGEVLGRQAPGVHAGAAVSQGQVLGYVGKTYISPNPMLHFEYYSGHASGPLTQRSRRGFERRSDLLNPSSYLTNWEQATFGTHY